MLIGRAPDIRPSEITDERVYLQRRDFIRLAGGPALATAGASLAAWEATTRLSASAPAAQSPLQNVRPNVVSTDEPVKTDGLCNAQATYHLEDVIRPHQLEERIYRHRCVEAWSMVIPWVGVALSAVSRRAKPQVGATFVEFTTLRRPSEMSTTLTLSSTAVDLGKHLGRKVSVTGSLASQMASMDKGAMAKEPAAFTVRSLKTVSGSCS